MKLLLKLFIIKKGNGLSPIMVEINYTKDICTLVVDLFKLISKYSQDHPTNNSNSDTSDNGDDNVIVVNDYESNSNNYKFMTHNSMVNIVRTNMIDNQVTIFFGEENDYKNK